MSRQTFYLLLVSVAGFWLLLAHLRNSQVPAEARRSVWEQSKFSLSAAHAEPMGSLLGIGR